MSPADSISRKQSSLLTHHLRAKRKLPKGSLLFAVEMVEIESTSENGRTSASTVCSSTFDLNQVVEEKQNNT